MVFADHLWPPCIFQRSMISEPSALLHLRSISGLALSMADFQYEADRVLRRERHLGLVTESSLLVLTSRGVNTSFAFRLPASIGSDLGSRPSRECQSLQLASMVTKGQNRGE